MPVGSFLVWTLVYAVAALATLWRLARDWRPLLDADWTTSDRNLAQMIGVFLLTPLAVWLHEWGHAAAMRWFGAPDPQIHYFFYWGYVTASFPFTPLQDFVVALAGPLVTYVLGAALLAVALLVPLRPAIALALATCGLWQLAIVLILYPAMSLLAGWGDFIGIYRSGVPLASLVVAVVHALSLIAFLWLMKRRWMKRFLAYPRPRPWRTHRAPAVAPPAAGRGQ
jgi:hypothetical protein